MTSSYTSISNRDSTYGHACLYHKQLPSSFHNPLISQGYNCLFIFVNNRTPHLPQPILCVMDGRTYPLYNHQLVIRNPKLLDIWACMASCMIVQDV